MHKQTTTQVIALIVLLLAGSGIFWLLQKMPDRAFIVTEQETEDQNQEQALLGLETVTAAETLRNEYVNAGYPSAKEMDGYLSGRFLEAFNQGELYTIQSVSDGYYPQTIYLVSVTDRTEVNYDYCGLYSPGLCLAIYEHGDEQRILQVFVGMRGAPTESIFMGHVAFDQFLPDAETLLLTSSIGDGPGGQEEWWALNIESGAMQKIVTMGFGYDGDGGATHYTLTHATSGEELSIELLLTEGLDEQSGNTKIIYKRLTMTSAVDEVLFDQALDIPSGAHPVLVVDAQSSMSGVIAFTFRFEEDTGTEGKNIYEWTNYTYDSTATPKLSQQQIP